MVGGIVLDLRITRGYFSLGLFRHLHIYFSKQKVTSFLAKLLQEFLIRVMLENTIFFFISSLFYVQLQNYLFDIKSAFNLH
jgi:hypothetical protein